MKEGFRTVRDTSITSRRPSWANRSALSCRTPCHRWRRCCPWRISTRRTIRPNSRWRACRAFPDWCRSTRVSGATSCCGRMRRAGARRSSVGLVARDAGTQPQEPSAPAPRGGGERAQYGTQLWAASANGWRGSSGMVSPPRICGAWCSSPRPSPTLKLSHH